MNRGYIRIWRKIEDSGVMDNPEVCRMYLHLMLKAASKPRRQLVGNTLVPLAPGQAVIGRKKLAADLSTTEGKVRSSLDALQKMGIIRLRGAAKFTIVSIIDWENAHISPTLPTPSGCPGHGAANTQKDASNDNHTMAAQTHSLPGAAVSAKTAADKMDEPCAEFRTLRDAYNDKAREEAPLAGYAEYAQCRNANVWPGLDAVLASVAMLANEDYVWKRGYAPGLARFIRERQWRKKPATNPRARHQALPGKPVTIHTDDNAIANNINTAAKILARRQGVET